MMTTITLVQNCTLPLKTCNRDVLLDRWRRETCVLQQTLKIHTHKRNFGWINIHCKSDLWLRRTRTHVRVHFLVFLQTQKLRFYIHKYVHCITIIELSRVKRRYNNTITTLILFCLLHAMNANQPSEYSRWSQYEQLIINRSFTTIFELTDTVTSDCSLSEPLASKFETFVDDCHCQHRHTRR